MMAARGLAPDTAFDAGEERARIAETLLRSAARLIDGRTEREIISGVCEALVRITPRIPLAWTWFGPADTQVIAPQVCAGPAADYARDLVIVRNAITEHGPAFRALDGHAAMPSEVTPDSLYGPWRQAALSHGVRAALALPLPSGLAGSAGLFVVYATLPKYFEQVGIGLFDSLAGLFGSVLTVAGERRELERTAHQDALTGLLNRHAAPLIERRLHRHSHVDPQAALLLLDLDHFKRVNDLHGHHAGDQALQAAAHAIRSVVRRGDDALRWGGEEFLICLHDSSLESAMQTAEKLRLAIAAVLHPTPMTCSIGVASLEPLQRLTDAVKRADEALYRAKAAGRNQVMAAA